MTHQLCILSEPNALCPSTSVVEGVEREVILKRAIARCHPSSKKHHMRFPGAQPVSLSRDDLHNVLSNEEYLVSLKSDGVRMLLFLTRCYEDSPIAVMIDRSLRTWEVEIWASDDFFSDTLYDGELVWDYTQSPPALLFLVFDIYCIRGESCTNLPYVERISKLNSTIFDCDVHADMLCNESHQQIGQLVLEENRVLAMNNSYNMRIVAKRVLPSSKTMTLWKTRGDEKNLNDGLIFTRNAPKFAPNIDHRARGVYKWKTDNTVDVLVVFPDSTDEHARRQLTAYVHDGASLIEITQIEHEHTEFNVVVKNNDLIECVLMQHLTSKEAPPFKNVMECKCDVEKDRRQINLFPIKQRNDKTSPNSIGTFAETVKNILEDIKIDEIFRAVASTA